MVLMFYGTDGQMPLLRYLKSNCAAAQKAVIIGNYLSYIFYIYFIGGDILLLLIKQPR